MKIKSTDSSYCTIKNIKVSGNIAYITLLIMSNTPQSKHCAFSFWIKDLETNQYTRANNNNYWIDRCNNYNNYSGNIDINMYKEIVLTVDITKSNTSSMQLNRWIRHIKITIKTDLAKQQDEDLWESDDLELLSDEIILPTLSNISCHTDQDLSLNLNFNLTYESQEDYNYTNNNLLFKAQTRSVYDNHILEYYYFDLYSKETKKSLLFEGISFINDPNGEYMCVNGHFIQYTSGDVTRYTKLKEGYDNPVFIDILILNMKEEVLYKKTIFFKPNLITHMLSYKGTDLTRIKSVVAKTSSGISRIKSITVK
jgi:hypothetical protein